MESFRAQAEPLQQEPAIPSSVRRPRFPGEAREGRKNAKRAKFGSLLETDSKFIDPLKEASLIMPEQTVVSTPLAVESLFSQKYTESTVVAEKSIVSSAYEYLLSIFELFKKKFRGARRKRARLTRRGEEALSQLQYLSALCDATSCRTPDEIIAAEGAFGEAYYEIMKLSSELEKMAVSEQHHHMHKYKHHISSLLQAD